MSDEELLEAATTAFRARTPGGEILPSPAWFDLPPEQRLAAHDLVAASRIFEAALDPDELSTTARAVLARIRG